jgi:hypothetical protein
MEKLWRSYAHFVQRAGIIPGIKREERKHVYCERECLRCGIKEKRKFTDNIDGTLAPIGWVRIVEADEDKTKPVQ